MVNNLFRVIALSSTLLLATTTQATDLLSCADIVPDKDISKSQLTKAAKIIKDFGTNGKLSFDQMRLYHAVQISIGIDSNQSGSLEYSEYIESLMYCSETDSVWQCGSGSDTQYSNLSKVIDPQKKSPEQRRRNLGENLMLNADGYWTAPIYARAKLVWREAASQENSSLTSGQLAAAFSSIDAKFSQINKKEWLESEIRKEAAAIQQEVAADDVLPFSVEKALKKKILCSSNKTRTLRFSYSEFRKLFSHPKSLVEFLKLVNQNTDNAGMSVSIEELLDPLLFKKAPITHQLFNRKISADLTNLVDEISSANMARIVDNLGDMERAAIKAKKNKILATEFGLPWIKGKGLVLNGGKPKYSPNKKTHEINLDKPYTTLQFIEDFTNAGKSAKPAKLSWTKSKGGSSVTNIDAAIRFDWYRPSWADLSEISFKPSLGVDYSRSGINDDKQEQIDYYLLGDFTFHKQFGFVKSSGLEFGPVYKEDKVERVETLTGLFQWRPILNIGGYVTGTQLQITDNIGLYLQPKIAYEFNDIRKQSIDSDLVDADLLIYNFVSKLTFRERLSLEYEYTDRKEQNSLGRSFDFEEWELSWKLDKSGFYSLTLEYEKGAIPPTFKPIDRYTLGLGVRF